MFSGCQGVLKIPPIGIIIRHIGGNFNINLIFFLFLVKVNLKIFLINNILITKLLNRITVCKTILQIHLSQLVKTDINSYLI